MCDLLTSVSYTKKQVLPFLFKHLNNYRVCESKALLICGVYTA